MTNNEFASMFSAGYAVWNGVAGYDTRPYVLGGEPLPVAYWEGFACGYVNDRDIAEGDIEGCLRDLPEGAIVVVPEYSGCHYCGESRYIKTNGEWRLHEVIESQSL